MLSLMILSSGLCYYWRVRLKERKRVRKVISLSTMVLLMGAAMVFIWFGLINPQFFRESKALDLLPLVREEARPNTDEHELAEEDHNTLRIEEAEVSLVNNENRVSWNLMMKEMVEAEAEAEADQKSYYMLADIEGEYFPLTGETFQIRAERGRMSKDFSQLQLFGQITVWRSDLRLVAQEARWTSQAEEIEFEKEVHFTRRDLEVEAEFILTDSNLEQIEIKGNSKWKFTDVPSKE